MSPRTIVIWLKTERPELSLEVKRVVAEGDYVVLHLLMKVEGHPRYCGQQQYDVLTA